MSAPAERLLEVEDLRVQFPTRHGTVRAVDGVSFHLDRGETLGVVGESGCGKSVTALSLMRLIRPPGRMLGGSIRFKGRDLARASESEIRGIRGDQMAMIFQDPMTSLNPVYRVGWQVGEPLRLHRGADKRAALEQAVVLLERVGIADARQRANQYPHQLSGGMRQRAMIGSGLSTQPALLIADEPTTALDVTVQAEILDLLRTVILDHQTSLILITHNLGVVAGMCDRIIVMYAGKIVESGPTDQVLTKPTHPYTWSLLRTVPRLDAEVKERLDPIAGAPPDLSRRPPGCAFHPRCPFQIDKCSTEEPALLPIQPNQVSACWVTQTGGELGI